MTAQELTLTVSQSAGPIVLVLLPQREGTITVSIQFNLSTNFFIFTPLDESQKYTLTIKSHNPELQQIPQVHSPSPFANGALFQPSVTPDRISFHHESAPLSPSAALVQRRVPNSSHHIIEAPHSGQKSALVRQDSSESELLSSAQSDGGMSSQTIPESQLDS